MDSLEGFHGRTPPLPAAEGSSSRMAPHLERELIFLILQFLDEKKFSETIHKLEKESGVYFNIKYFGNTILAGDWEKAENYVSGFIKINEISYSAMIFFHLRWNKYFEMLMRGDRVKAIDILNKELKVFESSYPEHYMKAAHCLTAPSCMEISPLSAVNFVRSLRVNAVFLINNMIVTHPILRNKLHFPSINSERLHRLLNMQLTGGERSAIPNVFKEN